MKLRNIKAANDGALDMEIEHPVHGWTPFTAHGSDPEQIGQALFAAGQAAIAAGSTDSEIENMIDVRQHGNPVEVAIQTLEREQMMPRPVRELLLEAAMLNALVENKTEEELYQTNAAYRRIKDLDDRISSMRSKKIK